jgi:predicted AlkP superfamily pyrophosphatase or phosphodiesterase
MTDLTSDLLPRLREKRLPGLDLGDGFLLPDYAGGSILNLPSSVCRWLGAPGLGAEPLRLDLTASFDRTYRRVILILVDALALHRLQRWMADGTAPVWSCLAQQGQLAALTSITPSTTSAALTSLWSGRSPAEHGVVGYEVWLKEYGIVANMILHAPITYQNDAGSLSKAGFKPEAALPFPTLGTHLAAHGIRSYALQHRSILRSGLSQMFFTNVDAQGFTTLSDLWINLRHVIEDHPHERQYLWIYTGEIDHFSHFYHPDDERTIAEFAAFSLGFERLFLDRLSPSARKDTLVLLTADHGMVATRKDPVYDLANHPHLNRLLHILPTGEHRLMYLFTRPGQGEAVRAYYDQTWPGQFTFIDPAEAVAAGLFGPGQLHPRLMDRLGDMVVAARDRAYLWWADKENTLVGRHGGLDAEEMLVPLLAVEL